MGRVAAVCPVHGAFTSMSVDMTGSQNVDMSGSMEACPHPGCGRLSPVVEGVFNFDATGQVSVQSAPAWSRRALVDALLLTDWTPAKITQTKKAAQRARRLAEKGAAQEAIDELAKSNRALGEAVQTLAGQRQPQEGWSKGDVMALLTLLLLVLRLLYDVAVDQQGQDRQLTEDDVVRVVEQTLQKQDGQTRPPTTDRPAPQ